ncbi:MAG: translation initiation factor IF-2 [Candidatus Cardinium sp.]|nr:translation initiation factor IF-2 [Candidatus Cardinium sp.]
MNHNEKKKIRLSQVARQLNVSTATIVAFLEKKGFIIAPNPNVKITVEQFDLLSVEFISASVDKREAAQVTIGKTYKHLGYDQAENKPKAVTKATQEVKKKTESHYEAAIPVLPSLKRVGKIILKADKNIVKAVEEPSVPPQEAQKATDKKASVSVPLKDTSLAETSKRDKIDFSILGDLKRPTVVGEMVIEQRSRQSSYTAPAKSAIKRVTPIKTSKGVKWPKGPKSPTVFAHKEKKSKRLGVEEKTENVSVQAVEGQIGKTFATLHQTSGSSTRAKYKKEKRTAHLAAEGQRQHQKQSEASVLKIMEFASASELASFMKVTVQEVLSTCMSLGMIVSINQRLDAETIAVVADEFGYQVEFMDVHDEEEKDSSSEAVVGEWEERPPIVTIMGHVDHGKTSLLDYIRATKVTAKEIGGITQHIAAYSIVTESNKKIVFLDTPGHEAFTAMRTRGARITDIVVIVVAADDSVMTQTKESISHAQVAGCAIIIAINKMDKPQANPKKVKEDLANLNILVEEWGGKYQCQEISAKTGEGVGALLDKILLEASLLELKAMPVRKAKGTIIESFLDTGRGYVATGIVQDGTLHIGDIVLAGVYYGKVKALLDHQGMAHQSAAPSMPVQLLGLNGAPRAGDIFRVISSMKEAGELAQKKQKVWREQTLRTKAQLTLDEIGRRLAVGNFNELHVIIKGDVDGSIEALAAALLSLSHEEVQVKILHKCVGAVSESDVLLAAATSAIIIAFHIKIPSQAKKLAEKEGVIIKQYDIIYAAIDDIRHTMQNLLAPAIEEIPTGRAEVKKVFSISKVGNIAGCQVQSGFVNQANPIRVIRNEQVIFTGTIHTLKHGLDEIKQAKAMSECGIHIKNFDTVETGDIIEGFERRETKRNL